MRDDSASSETPAATLSGQCVCRGIVVAPLFVVGAPIAVVRHVGSIDDETKALEAALRGASEELAALAATLDEDAADVLEFQQALIEDDDLVAPILQAVASNTAAEVAWREAIDAEIAEYLEGDDSVFAARAADLADLRDRVLAILCGDSTTSQVPTSPSIVVATDLAPSRLLALPPEFVSGIALGQGSATSHVALLAKARGVPMLTALGDLARCETGVTGLLDAVDGLLVVEPDDASVTIAAKRAERLAAQTANDARFLTQPVVVHGSEPVRMYVNIDHVSMLDAVNVEHCDGIGLARTEFLFEDGLPDESVQFDVYARLVAWARGRCVTVRTLDAGGDKPVHGIASMSESNPFLGVRGVRLSLSNPEPFMVQLRALLRAAARGPLRVMIPMVTVPAEMDAVIQLVNRACSELDERKVLYSRPQLGMMVEVPAAALSCDRFDVDFYSIGSNDLIQYATACARDNASVAPLARFDHPGVAYMIEAVVQSASRLGREVSVCGDMASDTVGARFLIERGVRALSVAPAMLGSVKAALLRHHNGASHAT